MQNFFSFSKFFNDATHTPPGDPATSFSNCKCQLEHYDGDRTSTSVFFKDECVDVVLDEGDYEIVGATRYNYTAFPCLQVLKALCDDDPADAAKLLRQEPFAALQHICANLHHVLHTILLEDTRSGSHRVFPIEERRIKRATLLEFAALLPRAYADLLFRHKYPSENNLLSLEGRFYSLVSTSSIDMTPSEESHIRLALQIAQVSQGISLAQPSIYALITPALDQLIVDASNATVQLSIAEATTLVEVLESLSEAGLTAEFFKLFDFLQTSLPGCLDDFAVYLRQLEERQRMPPYYAESADTAAQKQRFASICQILSRELPSLAPAEKKQLYDFLVQHQQSPIIDQIAKLNFSASAFFQFHGLDQSQKATKL